MIHIATVHWKTGKWIPIQRAYLRRHLQSEFRVYAWLNHIRVERAKGFFHARTELIKQHPLKLNELAETISSQSQDDHDILIFLDGDAFPIGDMESFIRTHLATHDLVAVQRLENNGDVQPHPCFCATTVGYWRSIKGDWNPGHAWVNALGQKVTDVGGNLLKLLTDAGGKWRPMLRSNQRNLHPVLFGIYENLIYHHGAGFRKPLTRTDHQAAGTMGELPPGSEPGSGQHPRMRRLLLRPSLDANRALSEAVFKSIQRNPEFYREFIGGPDGA